MRGDQLGDGLWTPQPTRSTHPFGATIPPPKFLSLPHRNSTPSLIEFDSSVSTEIRLPFVLGCQNWLRSVAFQGGIAVAEIPNPGMNATIPNAFAITFRIIALF
jgi:hypothetical protein